VSAVFGHPLTYDQANAFMESEVWRARNYHESVIQGRLINWLETKGVRQERIKPSQHAGLHYRACAGGAWGWMHGGCKHLRSCMQGRWLND